MITANWIKPIARIGLAVKGLLYCLLGMLTLMSALHINGQRSDSADRTGALEFIGQQPAGKTLLIIVTIGLFCYSAWRFLQALFDTEHEGMKMKGMMKRLAYLFSGGIYLSFGLVAVRYLNHQRQSGGSQKEFASQILNQPAGQWLLFLLALTIAGVGIYQIWYGLSEKYRKHVNLQELSFDASRSLLRAGKIGYIARGGVWLIIAFLFVKAAINNRASEAGDTSDAFGFIQDKSYGSYILIAIAIGFICYGVFNFVRAVFERFKT